MASDNTNDSHLIARIFIVIFLFTAFGGILGYVSLSTKSQQNINTQVLSGDTHNLNLTLVNIADTYNSTPVSQVKFASLNTTSSNCTILCLAGALPVTILNYLIDIANIVWKVIVILIDVFVTVGEILIMVLLSVVLFFVILSAISTQINSIFGTLLFGGFVFIIAYVLYLVGRIVINIWEKVKPT